MPRLLIQVFFTMIRLAPVKPILISCTFRGLQFREPDLFASPTMQPCRSPPRPIRGDLSRAKVLAPVPAIPHLCDTVDPGPSSAPLRLRWFYRVIRSTDYATSSRIVDPARRQRALRFCISVTPTSGIVSTTGQFSGMRRGRRPR